MESDILCVECSTSIPPESVCDTADGRCCPECLYRYWQTCYDCQSLVRSERTTLLYINWSLEQSFCEPCAEYNTFHCDNCGQSYHTDHIGSGYVTGWGDWCECCLSASATYCDMCDEYHPDSDGCQNDDSGRWINSYSFKPSPVFHRAVGETAGVPGRAYFGIELEVECGDSKSEPAEYLTRRFESDAIYLKEDGSLNYGFEIVSHPRTLQSWRDWTVFGESLKRLSTEYNCRSWGKTTAGLHVHMNKKSFEDVTHMARFNTLFTKCEDQWLDMAARRRTGYANMSGSKPRANIYSGQYIHLPDMVKSGMTDHSAAVNWSPGSTVEVRIFRPALDHGRVVACVELVAAANEFTRTVGTKDMLSLTQSAKDGSALWARFVAFLYENGYSTAFTEVTSPDSVLDTLRKGK